MKQESERSLNEIDSLTEKHKAEIGEMTKKHS